MNLGDQSRKVAFLLAVTAGGWWPAAGGATAQATHCSGTEARAPAQAAQAETWVSTAGTHECSHCPAGHCSTLNRCSAASSPALVAAGPVLEVPTSIARPALWVAYQPLSANPTPPIPPPQLVL